MRPAKYLAIAGRFAQRIRNGDYHLHEMPAERDLAVEAGVSHTTARKAVQHLVNEGLLYRQPNGRAAVPGTGGGARDTPAKIALLAPSWESPTLAGWRAALARACERRGVSSRAVLYTHWDDPAIATTLQGFDGSFLMPAPGPVPESVILAVQQNQRPVVVLDSDWSRHGVRSVLTDPPAFVCRMLDHLASLGHHRIDCFNVQPTKVQYIVQWRLWLAAQRIEGILIDEPVKPGEDSRPAAYAAIDRRLRAGQFSSKALYCTTEPAAGGAMAALLDHGLRPGHDVAVCTLDSGELSAFCTPSLTAMAHIDRMPFMNVCLDWMLGRVDQAWPGPLLLQPPNGRVVVRQSTVPDAKRHRRMA